MLSVLCLQNISIISSSPTVLSQIRIMKIYKNLQKVLQIPSGGLLSFTNSFLVASLKYLLWPDVPGIPLHVINPIFTGCGTDAGKAML